MFCNSIFQLIETNKYYHYTDALFHRKLSLNPQKEPSFDNFFSTQGLSFDIFQ